MIEFSNVTMQHGNQILYLGATFSIHAGEKIGLVGANGSGKTTIFRLIMGEEQPDEGSVERPTRKSVGYFRQDFADYGDREVLYETLAGAGALASLGQELAALEARLGDVDDPDYDKIIERYGEVQVRFQDGGGYDLEAKAKTILHGLGFAQEQMDGKIGALSGGWRMRVQLARLLLMRPDVLLLDEPTNYLDIESILWLEQWLRDTSSTVVMTCHDRDVMNRVVRRVLEIDGGRITSYTGDYDAYERARVLDVAQREAEYEKQQAMLAKELRFIDRFKKQPSKASQVQSRAKKIEKIERVEPPRRIVEKHFNFRKPERSGNDVITVKNVAKRYGARLIHQNLDLIIRRGERWAIMGENGAGKTTLLKIMAGVLSPDEGSAAIGASVLMGYFAQHQLEQLSSERSVLEELEAHAPMAGQPTLRSLAGAFGFPGDDIEKQVAILSGAEKSRLALAKMLFDAPNLLILDEPTNHLDILTKRALVKALSDYDGTIIFVSHDRAFLRALANRVLELSPQGPRVYAGPYDAYVQAMGREAPGLRSN